MNLLDVAYCLETGARRIRENGWFRNGSDPIQLPGPGGYANNCHCAFTSLNTYHFNDSVINATVVELASDIKGERVNEEIGLGIIFKWNDSQNSPEPVIAQMLDTALRLRRQDAQEAAEILKYATV